MHKKSNRNLEAQAQQTTEEVLKELSSRGRGQEESDMSEHN
jgi:hypothetical protein